MLSGYWEPDTPPFSLSSPLSVTGFPNPGIHHHSRAAFRDPGDPRPHSVQVTLLPSPLTLPVPSAFSAPIAVSAVSPQPSEEVTPDPGGF
jgi:hypothetical protein